MSKSKKILLPKSMPLEKRISQVGSILSEWLDSLNDPYDVQTDVLRLTECIQKNTGYHYHYTLLKPQKDLSN
jgi:hypothetical protein